MPIPWVISIPTPYVVMSNPLITQIKTKNWFVPFHVLSQQVFSIVTFLFGYISPILISLLVVLSTFKFWSMLLAIMKTTPRMKVFILGVKFCIQKSTLIIYQMVIKLGISKSTLMHNIHVLTKKLRKLIIEFII